MPASRACATSCSISAAAGAGGTERESLGPLARHVLKPDVADDLVDRIAGLEDKYKAKTDAELKAVTADFKQQLDKPDLIAELLKGDPNHRYAAAARQIDLKKIWDAAAP